jgi:NADPH:quinone reductase-like Zn-dependent oxidoreductase
MLDRPKPSIRPRAVRIPATMRAAAIDRFGGPDVLTLHELPVPVPDAHEVLIALHTAGVGSWDVDIRKGWNPGGKLKFPLVLGTDGSGTVVQAGENVRRLKLGDKVYSYAWNNPKGGFYAQYVAVEADTAAHLPEGLDLRRAGAIPVTGLTALQGIDDALHLKKSESIIVHGASGAVGTLAVQFAKLRGANVFASASGADGVKLVRRLGADEAVDGRHADIAAAAHKFAPKGVDTILATVGGAALERAIDVLRPGGRLAYPNGIEPEPKRHSGIDVIPYDAVSGVREFQRLNKAIESMKLRVVIGAEYPLTEAYWAHQRIEAGHVLGKVILRIR